MTILNYIQQPYTPATNTMTDAFAQHAESGRDLPGLESALDTSLIARRLRAIASMQDSLGRQWAQDEWTCKILRVRHRQGVRAVIQYECTISNQARCHSQTLLFTGYLYAGTKAASVYRSIVAESQGDLSEDYFPAVTYLSDIQLLLLAFPLDRRLPALRDAVCQLPATYQPLVCRDLGWQDAPPSLRPASIDTIRYRAGLGATLRYTFQRLPPVSTLVPLELDSSLVVAGHPARYFCKLFVKAEESESSWNTLRLLRQSPGFEAIVCEPIGHCEDTRSILLKQADGTSLDDLLLANDRPFEVDRLARSVAGMHLSQTPLDRTHVPDRQRQNVERAATRLLAAVPDEADCIQYLAQLGAQVDSDLLVPSHRDLKLEHMFFADRSLTIIDWDSSALAHPMLDVTMFIQRLWARAIQLRTEQLAARHQGAAQAFWGVYRSMVPEAWLNVHQAYLAGAALEVALGFYGRQERNWQEIVRELLRTTVKYFETAGGRVV